MGAGCRAAPCCLLRALREPRGLKRSPVSSSNAPFCSGRRSPPSEPLSRLCLPASGRGTPVPCYKHSAQMRGLGACTPRCDDAESRDSLHADVLLSPALQSPAECPWQALQVPLLYRRGHRGTGRLRNLPEATQRVEGLECRRGLWSRSLTPTAEPPPSRRPSLPGLPHHQLLFLPRGEGACSSLPRPPAWVLRVFSACTGAVRDLIITFARGPGW